MDKQRVIQEKVEKLLGMFPFVAVVGSRQCGKSTFVNNLRPQWQYYDLESPDDYQLISSDPVAFFSINHRDVIIDEAQQYPEIFKTLRGVVDADRKRKGRFVITGSSSPTIVKEITESLAGRIATVELWPFKQCEYHDTGLSEFYSLICDRSAAPDDLLQLHPSTSLGQSMAVWFKGGFPEPLIEGEANDEFHRLWTENYIAN